MTIKIYFKLKGNQFMYVVSTDQNQKLSVPSIKNQR